jgi:glycosyltransferase involved in cell wall biosynthesis
MRKEKTSDINNPAKNKKIVAICTISDISTDYRLHKMATTISKNDFSPFFITRKRKDYLNKSEKFPVKIMNLFFEKGPLFYIEYNIRLFFKLILNPPDIIFSVDLDTLSAARSAAFVLRKPLIFDSHEYFPESPELQHRPFIKKIWETAEKLFVPGLKYGITVCESIANIYKEKYNADFKVIRNLPLAVNNENNPAPDINPKETFTLIYQGAVNIGRGIKESIESLKYLNNVNLIIVGEGDIFEEVKEMVVSNGLSDRVTITGKIPFSQLPQYTKQADLGLILLENMGLNYFYSLPNRVFDFIKYQVPILAIDFPEIKKIVEGYDVGICIPDMEPQHIAEIIEKIRTDKEKIKQWKLNAEKASEELTWENDEINLIEILNDLR